MCVGASTVLSAAHDTDIEPPICENTGNESIFNRFTCNNILLYAWKYLCMFRFQTAFNHEEAKEAGRINPSKGIDPEYDSVKEELQGLKQELDDYLSSQRKYFGCKVMVH